MFKWIGIIVVGLIVLGIIGAAMAPQPETTITPGAVSTGAAATGAVATSTTTPQAKVGDTLRHGNWEYTVTKVEKVKTLVWSEYGNKTDALGTWLVVSMTLKNVGDRNFPINRHDFEVHTGTGNKYDTSTKFETYSFITHVKLTQLGEQYPPGTPIKTALVFDIAAEAAGLKLVLLQANDATIALE